jgi:N-methylhydantoinase A/acetophenone carboxylase
LIRQQYPEAYLGHMPVLLSSEVSPQMGEYRRTITCILDAFLRHGTEDHIVSLTDELRDSGYKHPFYVAKCTGGISSASRTRPIQLFGSGPVSGIIGASALAKSWGIHNALVTDMGGTSFDLGLIVEGRERTYDYNPVIDRWRVQVPLVAHWSIGAGGGSIAHLEAGILKVGPQSARALPGPACYGRGGTQPTVTDADLVLGYVDPEYFLGGRISLDRELAVKAIHDHVAVPMGVDDHTAAWSIKQLVDGNMGQEMYRITAMTSGLDPRDFVILALGGAGPAHAAGYADYSDVSRIATFPFGSVFGAFGTLHLDVQQTYEKTYSTIVYSSEERSIQPGMIPAFNDAVANLVSYAQKDMEEEGFDLKDLAFQLEVLMRFGQQRHHLPIDSPGMEIDQAGLQLLIDRFVEAYANSYGRGSLYLEAGVEILGLRLNALAPMATPPWSAGVAEVAGEPSKGTRSAYWGPKFGVVDTPIFQRERLGQGFSLAGPALIEAADTVCTVPPDWTYRVDERLIGWMDHQEGRTNG